MPLTRKFLKDAAKEAGIELPKELEEAIIDAHVESRDAAVAKAVEPLSEQIEAAKAENADGEYKTKWEQEHEAFEKYKGEVEAEKLTAKKQAAVKALLAELKISDRRHDVVMRATDLSEVDLDDKGQIKNAEKMREKLTADWSDFIETTETKGSHTPTPPVRSMGDNKEAEVIARVRTAMGLPDPTETKG